MKHNKFFLLILLLIIIFGIVYYRIIYNRQPKLALTNSPSPVLINSPPPALSLSPSPSQVTNLADPIKDFKSRITKKPFGIYITPETSPVKPERFSGYHTGVDIEYDDIAADVPVYALTDGAITYSNWVSGYGGVLIFKVDINGLPLSVLYGHLRPSSLPNIGMTFKKGDQMAYLGTGNSQETDNERRHLHFGVLSNDRIDLKGYVQKQSELSDWIDPLSLYN